MNLAALKTRTDCKNSKLLHDQAAFMDKKRKYGKKNNLIGYSPVFCHYLNHWLHLMDESSATGTDTQDNFFHLE
jgi:hypothetical protein